MKTIDVRFSVTDMAELSSMIGKRMIQYKCDPFIYSTSVYGIVGIKFDDVSYAFTNSLETMDYFGDQEDVANFKISRIPYENIQSLVQNQSMIDTPVNSIITDIIVVNEHQSLFENDIQTYEVMVTRGVIFKFDDGRELSFEKNIWFSEDITVERGYDLIQRFTPPEEFSEGWSGNYRGECIRELISCK